MDIGISRSYWEYADFTYRTWQCQEAWCCFTYTDSRYLIIEARRFFWQADKEAILAELQPWLDQGWEALDEIGPEAVRIQKYEQLDLDVGIADIFLWVITLGVAFVIQLWLDAPRRLVTYKPVEFSIRMRRLNAQHVQLANSTPPA